MEPFYVTFAAVAVTLVGVLLWRIFARRPPLRPPLPYIKRPSLLTPAEQRFYRVLLQAAPKGVTAFVKVRLLDVAPVMPGTPKSVPPPPFRGMRRRREISNRPAVTSA